MENENRNIEKVKAKDNLGMYLHEGLPYTVENDERSNYVRAVPLTNGDIFVLNDRLFEYEDEILYELIVFKEHNKFQKEYRRTGLAMNIKDVEVYLKEIYCEGN